MRSQKDVRISFRVRERKDVHLILGHGMLAAGWHAHTLNAPGKFLIAATEHDTPKRARAYLLTDQAVEAAANYYAAYRPPLDPVSQRAVEEDPCPEETVVPPDTDTMIAEHEHDGPDIRLWTSLVLAPPKGPRFPT